MEKYSNRDMVSIACEFIKWTQITATLLLLAAMKVYTVYTCGSIPHVLAVLRFAPWGTFTMLT